MNRKRKNHLNFFLTTKEMLKKNKYIVTYIEELKDEVICFLDSNKKIKVFSSFCPHFGGEIYYDKKNDQLSCKWHGWKFCKNTGKCLSYPLKSGLSSYDFEVRPDYLKKYDFKSEDNSIFLVYEPE